MRMSRLELLTTTEMAAADRAAIADGIPGVVLMENAGLAVAAEAGQMVGAQSDILVLCGPGNNGGDGFVAARLLEERGHKVTLVLLGDADRLGGDAAIMAARWFGEVNAWSPDVLDKCGPDGPDLILDALFGAGLSRPLEGTAAEIVEHVNNSGAAVLAVDVPSGLDGTTGRPLGAAIAADKTVTFFCRKPGHVLMPGRALCGPVTVADIGIPDSVFDTIAPKTFLNRPLLWHDTFPDYLADGHKYDRGHSLVISGPAHRTGAARMAARAALRMGAGLVTVASPTAAVAANAAHLTAIMIEPFSGPTGLLNILADARKNAVLIGPGCGVGAETRVLVEACLDSTAAAVLDADALTSFEGTRDSLYARLRPGDVLTPHAGEFRRLFPDAADRHSKLDAARAAAERAGAIVVYKGPDTIVASPEGFAAINDNAPPWLATAGSGDVLAGMITGLLSQGMPAWHAACAAVWLHGACGELLGRGLIAEDLPEALPDALAALADMVEIDQDGAAET
jgi:ADP-dependent NAD(P)H-hydrate dehydratase / NAD(P)H-hydrate epimerase